MIVLCANCHGLKGSGPRKLDRKALRQYKANLGIINNRYGDIEHRILEYFALNPEAESVQLTGGQQFMVMCLLRDGLLEATDGLGDLRMGKTRIIQTYRLTSAGCEFIQRWVHATPLVANDS
jgi:hypothetical protein